MGTYHKLVNFTTNQIINPHGIGSGLKFEEIKAAGTVDKARELLTGPARPALEFSGEWAGDDVQLVSDAAYDFDELDTQCVDITEQVAEMLIKVYGGEFVGTGWLDYRKNGVDAVMGE